MAGNTILLDFSVTSTKLTNSEESKSLQDDMEEVLSSYVPGLKRQQILDFAGSFIVLLTGDRGTHVTLRGFPQGLITCNIEYYKEDEEQPLLLLESVSKLEKDLAEKLSSKRCHSLPALKRGDLIDRYFPTTDGRILEYDIDKVLYEETSPFQKILIVHSLTLGNILVLDGLLNLAESDLIYTETLMQRGKESYEGKEIVILGGGDGALLWELLKEKPKFVYMFEIDEMVMKACSKYLRRCCGDCLDKLKGDNYEIVVGDCLETLNQFIAEGRKFDYVFGDLTDIPLSESPQGEVWDFTRLILNSALKILKPQGKYMTHGNGSSCLPALSMFEEQLQKLCVPVEFTRAQATVPSFLEDWVFYQVWQKQN